MSITFINRSVASQSSTSAGPGPITLSFPGGIALGDFLLLIAISYISDPTPVPAGWTEVGSGSSDSGQYSVHVYWKFYASSDGPNITVDNFYYGQMVCRAYRNVLSGAVDQYALAVSSVASTSLTVPALATTAVVNEKYLVWFFNAGGPLTSVPGDVINGITYNYLDTGTNQCFEGEKDFASLVPPSSESASTSGPNNWLGVAVTLKPALSNPGAGTVVWSTSPTVVGNLRASGKIRGIANGATANTVGKTAGSPSAVTFIPPHVVASNPTNNATLTISPPAGILSGDLMLLWISSYTGPGGSSPPATLSGWTIVGSQVDSSNDVLALFYRYYTISDPTSYVWSGNGTGPNPGLGYPKGIMRVYRGVSTPDATAGNQSSSATTFSIPTLSATRFPNEWYAAAFFNATQNIAYTGDLVDSTNDTTGWFSFDGNRKFGSAGSVPSAETATSASAGRWTGIAITFAPGNNQALAAAAVTVGGNLRALARQRAIVNGAPVIAGQLSVAAKLRGTSVGEVMPIGILRATARTVSAVSTPSSVFGVGNQRGSVARSDGAGTISGVVHAAGNIRGQVLAGTTVAGYLRAQPSSWTAMARATVGGFVKAIAKTRGVATGGVSLEAESPPVTRPAAPTIAGYATISGSFQASMQFKFDTGIASWPTIGQVPDLSQITDFDTLSPAPTSSSAVAAVGAYTTGTMSFYVASGAMVAGNVYASVRTQAIIGGLAGVVGRLHALAQMQANTIASAALVGRESAIGFGGGLVASISTVTGDIAATGSGQGVATDSSVILGNLSAFGKMQASVSTGASVQAVGRGSKVTVGQAAGTTTVTGSARSLARMIALVGGKASIVGNLRAQAGGRAVGAGIGEASGVESALAEMTAEASGAAVVAAGLTATGEMQAAAAGNIEITGNLEATGELVGVSISNAAALGELRAIGVTSGAVESSTAVSGEFAASAGMQGLASGTATIDWIGSSLGLEARTVTVDGQVAVDGQSAVAIARTAKVGGQSVMAGRFRTFVARQAVASGAGAAIGGGAWTGRWVGRVAGQSSTVGRFAARASQQATTTASVVVTGHFAASGATQGVSGGTAVVTATSAMNGQMRGVADGRTDVGGTLKAQSLGQGLGAGQVEIVARVAARAHITGTAAGSTDTAVSVFGYREGMTHAQAAGRANVSAISQARRPVAGVGRIDGTLTVVGWTPRQDSVVFVAPISNDCEVIASVSDDFTVTVPISDGVVIVAPLESDLVAELKAA